MKTEVHTKQRAYPVIVERGSLYHIAELVGKCGTPYIVSDDGVPEKWRNTLIKQYPDASVFVFKNGEQSKNIHTLEAILTDMLKHNISRSDTLIALGGGVVGDMAGFAAAIYMRGIRYVNIPTTTVSQIDSCIGGKTAIDLAGIKNSVGAFWQPSMVIADPDTLATLSARHFHNGLAEAVKSGLIRDKKLFEIFEADDYSDRLDEIIERSLLVKKDIVERDEREAGLRKLLNFGHTYGHAYESYYELDRYLHGECVAMGMMTILKNGVIRDRVKKVLQKLELPVSCNAEPCSIIRKISNDKKSNHSTATVVQVDEIGNAHLEEWNEEKLLEALTK